jgi:hypothetical protein
MVGGRYGGESFVRLVLLLLTPSVGARLRGEGLADAADAADAAAA